MIRYKLDLLKKVRKHLQNGGVIAYPTEYCFGLGCDPFNYRAISRILSLKGRSKKKGLIVIAGKISELKRLTMPLDNEVSNYWPGPFTLVVGANKNVPACLTGLRRKIAVRVTAHPLVKQLCGFLQMPLVSTSANYSGFRPAKTSRECRNAFGKNVMVLPGTTSFLKAPSTIIDWDSRKVLRGNAK